MKYLLSDMFKKSSLNWSTIGDINSMWVYQVRRNLKQEYRNDIASLFDLAFTLYPKLTVRDIRLV